MGVVVLVRFVLGMHRHKTSHSGDSWELRTAQREYSLLDSTEMYAATIAFIVKMCYV